MIAALLDAASRRVKTADACTLTDHTLSVTCSEHAVEAVHRDFRVAHLRVEEDGRLGTAARDDHDVGEMVQAALASAKSGPPGSLLRPLPAALPAVITFHPGAAALGVRELSGFADTLRARVVREGRIVQAWSERSAGRADVGSTRGVLAGYDVSMVGVGLTVAAPAAAGRAVVRLRHVAAGQPDEQVIAGLAAEAEEYLQAPLLDEMPPAGRHPVWLAPRALAVVLAPLRQSLLAHGVWSAHGPWSRRVGDRILSERITLVDDAFAPDRPGSRPIDDEGVITQRRVLIEQGTLKGALADLEAATRFGIPSTGSAKRGHGSRTWIGWSNVVMEPGEATESQVFDAADGGVLVKDLTPAAGNLSHGRVAWSTPWAYKVEKGRIAGRYERYELRGAVFEMLNRVSAVGREGRWIGANCLPDLVIGVD